MTNCSPFDLRDYFFSELASVDAETVKTHVAGCSVCREELERLQLTRHALSLVAEEEPPRRVAFVSDKVFEPSWWQRFWASGAQIGFVSSALLAGAIVFHGVVGAGPAEAPRAIPAPVAVDRAKVESLVRAEVAAAVIAAEQLQTARLMEAVEARVAQSERRVGTGLVSLRDDLRDYLDRENKMRMAARKAAFYSGDGQ